MPFSVPGLVLGAVLAQNVTDPNRATQIELLGGVLGTTPIGLVLVATLAQQADRGTITPTVPPGGIRAPTEVQVPDVAGAADLVAAEQLLVSRGLRAASPQAVVSDQPIDTILGTSPPAGTFVRLGTAVTVLVSGGVQVPDVTKQKVEDAERTLTQIGFTTDVQEETDRRGPAGIVVRQDPVGGTFASVGDLVTLFVFKPALEVTARSRRSKGE